MATRRASRKFYSRRPPGSGEGCPRPLISLPALLERWRPSSGRGAPQDHQLNVVGPMAASHLTSGPEDVGRPKLFPERDRPQLCMRKSFSQFSRAHRSHVRMEIVVGWGRSNIDKAAILAGACTAAPIGSLTTPAQPHQFAVVVCGRAGSGPRFPGAAKRRGSLTCGDGSPSRSEMGATADQSVEPAGSSLSQQPRSISHINNLLGPQRFPAAF